MTVTSQMTSARSAIAAALTTEFAAEGFTPVNDRLHESMGGDGRTRIGTSPIRSRPMPSNKLVQVSEVLVQFYGKWKKEIDPETRVDPAAIENYVERFLRRMRTSDPGTGTVWYFDVAEVTYPNDPTGNKTRFEARVNAYGNNPAHIETTG